VKTEKIKEIGVDLKGRLYLVPSREKFPFIYRSATGVHWDEKSLFLYSPEINESECAAWFQEICAAVKSEYDVLLMPSEATQWTNIPPATREAITSVFSG
jgi:hypothetical protein